MIKHIWSVLCRESIIDSETNNISLLNVFEQLSADVSISAPDKKHTRVNVPIKYEVVSLWSKLSNKKVNARIEVEIVDPQGQNLKSFTQELEFPAKMRRMRSRLRITGMSLTVPGDYKYKIKIKEENQDKYIAVAELPLQVELKKEVEPKTANN